MRKNFTRYSKCKFSDYPYVTVSPAPKCEIGVMDSAGNVQPQSLDDVLRASNGCSESVEAEYAAAQVRQGNCPTIKPSGRTVAEDRALSLLEEQKRVDSLEQSLLMYLSSCKPDPKTARQISKMGLGPLLKAGRKARLEWLAEWVAAQFGAFQAGGK
jgi:hypothetical protein